MTRTICQHYLPAVVAQSNRTKQDQINMGAKNASIIIIIIII
jgi:hypothetical protein